MNYGSSGVALAQSVSCLGGDIVIIVYQLISEGGESNLPGIFPKRLRPFLRFSITGLRLTLGGSAR
jgi:hypothetical protein